MKKTLNKLSFLLLVGLLFSSMNAMAQLQTYELSVKGDTLNAVRKDGKKVGKWVIRIEEIRGEPGYEEEGVYKDGEKHGVWRRYSLEGDLLSVENYFQGGKDGIQYYYTPTGELEHEESWRAYNPNTPYDTIWIYGTGNNEIIGKKLVKAVPYAVKQGDWKYYNPQTGALIRTVKYELNNEVVPKPAVDATASTSAEPAKKKEVKKTPEMLEWEKKHRGKKGAIRDGAIGL